MTARVSLKSAYFLLMKCLFSFYPRRVLLTRSELAILTRRLDLFLYISEERNAKRQIFYHGSEVGSQGLFQSITVTLSFSLKELQNI